MIQEIETGKIKPYPQNTKKHPSEQIKKIAESIKNYGFKQPIVVDRDFVIIAGHGRYEAGKTLDLKTMPCIIADDLTPKQCKKYRLMDNRTNESEWNIDNLIAELMELPELKIEFDDLLEKSENVDDTDLKVNETFEVVVECENVEKQEKTFNDLIKQNYKCRLLTL